MLAALPRERNAAIAWAKYWTDCISLSERAISCHTLMNARNSSHLNRGRTLLVMTAVSPAAITITSDA